MNPSKTTISGYTTSHNCIDMNYPFREVIANLLGFCDEVIVVDSGSKDGTIAEIQHLARQESRLKFFVEPVDFSNPRWAIENDGNLKARARAKCQAEYCWQTDLDEFVPAEDMSKIQLLPRLLGDQSLLWLPMVEFWGSFEYIRADFFTWKARFSKNDPRICHGIPRQHKLFDQNGQAYIRPFYSDGCNYLWRDSETDVAPVIPLPISNEELKRLTESQYDELFFQCLDQLPFVLHVSWLDLPRKIRAYKGFWQRFHQSMYNLFVADSAETNVMFNKPWADVSDADIALKAEELRRIGPRSFHHKIDPTKIGRTIKYRRPIPEALEQWWSRTKAADAVLYPELPKASSARDPHSLAQ